MKFNLFTVSAALAFLFLLFSSARNPNNPPLSKTGAPGENTCAQATCHAGGAFTGSVLVTGVPDTVLYGQTYAVTLTNMSNAVRAGFQLTCLDSLNTKCGNLTTGTGVNIASASNRQYARQTQPKMLSGGQTSWTFSWTAPTSAAGEEAKFYFTSLCANNDGDKTGDNVLIGSKTIVFTAVSPVNEPALAKLVNLYPTQAQDVLHIDLTDISKATLKIFDASGVLLLERPLEAQNEIVLNDFKPGPYMAQILSSQGAIAKKFIKL